jgi:hypothetical protein
MWNRISTRIARIEVFLQQHPLLTTIIVFLAITTVVALFVLSDMRTFREPKRGYIDETSTGRIEDDLVMSFIIHDIHPDNNSATMDISWSTNPITSTSPITELVWIIYSGNVEVATNGRIESKTDRALTINTQETGVGLENLQVQLERTSYSAAVFPFLTFPFESYRISLFVQPINLKAMDEERDINITEQTYYQIDDPEFLVFSEASNIDFSQGEESDTDSEAAKSSLLMEISRPVYVCLQVISIIFLVGLAVLWSLYKVIKLPRQSNTTNTSAWVETFEILGTNIALIVAIPDIRNWLVPDELIYAPLVDLPLLIILLLSFFTLTWFALKTRS